MQVWIECFEGGIYMAKSGDDAPQDWLRDKHNKPMKFASPEAVRQHFAHKNVAQAWLIQDNPYNEMIGLEAEPVEPACIPLYWNTKDV